MTKKRTILGKELEGCNLEEQVMSATEGNGVSMWGDAVMVGTLPCVVIVAVGPAADTWLQIYDAYLKQMAVDGVQQKNGH